MDLKCISFFFNNMLIPYCYSWYFLHYDIKRSVKKIYFLCMQHSRNMVIFIDSIEESNRTSLYKKLDVNRKKIVYPQPAKHCPSLFLYYGSSVSSCPVCLSHSFPSVRFSPQPPRRHPLASQVLSLSSVIRSSG